MPRRKLFSVSISNCKVDTFTVGGPGGGGKDTSNTGVRITHPPSGAIGECRETRYQQQNKRCALERLARTKEFRMWARIQAAKIMGRPTVDDLVEEAMQPKNLKIEGRNADGKWDSI